MRKLEKILKYIGFGHGMIIKEVNYFIDLFWTRS